MSEIFFYFGTPNEFLLKTPKGSYSHGFNTGDTEQAKQRYKAMYWYSDNDRCKFRKRKGGNEAEFDCQWSIWRSDSEWRRLNTWIQNFGTAQAKHIYVNFANDDYIAWNRAGGRIWAIKYPYPALSRALANEPSKLRCAALGNHGNACVLVWEDGNFTANLGPGDNYGELKGVLAACSGQGRIKFIALHTRRPAQFFIVLRKPEQVIFRVDPQHEEQIKKALTDNNVQYQALASTRTEKAKTVPRKTRDVDFVGGVAKAVGLGNAVATALTWAGGLLGGSFMCAVM